MTSVVDPVRQLGESYLLLGGLQRLRLLPIYVAEYTIGLSLNITVFETTIGPMTHARGPFSSRVPRYPRLT